MGTVGQQGSEKLDGPPNAPLTLNAESAYLSLSVPRHQSKSPHESTNDGCQQCKSDERPDQCRSIHQILDHFWMIAQYIGFGSIWCRHLVGPVEHCSSQSARENPIGRYAFKEARTFFRVGLKEQLPCRVGIRPLTILDDSRQVLYLHLVGQGLGCVVSEN